MSLDKFLYIRSPGLTRSAKGESCSMRSPECNGNSETVVWCHSNSSIHGKGKGIKASDAYGFYGCSGCHRWFDSYSDDELALMQYFMRAFTESHQRLIAKGIVKYEGTY